MFVCENKALLLFQFKEQMFNLDIKSECEFQKSKLTSPMHMFNLDASKKRSVEMNNNQVNNG